MVCSSPRERGCIEPRWIEGRQKEALRKSETKEEGESEGEKYTECKEKKDQRERERGRVGRRTPYFMNTPPFTPVITSYTGWSLSPVRNTAVVDMTEKLAIEVLDDWIIMAISLLLFVEKILRANFTYLFMRFYDPARRRRRIYFDSIFQICHSY